MKGILEKLARGEITVAQAERLLRVWAVEEVAGLAKLDIRREIRRRVPEVVLAEGKTPKDVREIALRAAKRAGRAIISRATKDHFEALRRSLPGELTLEVEERARMAVLRQKDFMVEKAGGKIGLLTAGTSDIPVAEEARIVAEEMGCEVLQAYDVGIAGIHRLFQPLKEMLEADVAAMVVVAGREGALPALVAGLVDVPVIGVPTSSSWGLGGKGLAALASMLQACPLGLTVVNVDGGVAAGAAAALIANRVARAEQAGGQETNR